MVVSQPTRARARLCRQGFVKLSDHENETARRTTFRRFQRQTKLDVDKSSLEQFEATLSHVAPSVCPFAVVYRYPSFVLGHLKNTSNVLLARFGAFGPF